MDKFDVGSAAVDWILHNVSPYSETAEMWIRAPSIHAASLSELPDTERKPSYLLQ
jgi:hypothetical protein